MTGHNDTLSLARARVQECESREVNAARDYFMISSNSMRERYFTARHATNSARQQLKELECARSKESGVGASDTNDGRSSSAAGPTPLASPPSAHRPTPSSTQGSHENTPKQSVTTSTCNPAAAAPPDHDGAGLREAVRRYRQLHNAKATFGVSDRNKGCGCSLCKYADAALSAGEKAGGGCELPANVLTMCKHRGWSLHWTARGAYLHLESSELIEAVRGKHGNPIEEAADVLIVLMSITESVDIAWPDVLRAAQSKVDTMMTIPKYPGEEYTSEADRAKGGS